MFADTNDDGQAYTQEDWERRARVEPLVEVTQHKGNSECAVGLGTSDEECAFEQIFPLCKDGKTTGCARDGSYIRGALKRGLELEGEIGLNPYKLGFIGSTDTHNSIPGATEEDTFQGHHASIDDTVDKRLKVQPGAARPNLILNPGGLAGVWAESNTRADIFDALRRKETFATSGTRIKVRFFGGFGLPADLTMGDAALERAYAQGVPMGGDLRAPAAGAAGAEPRFLIWALKDPSGANLDRIQVVKSWVPTAGPGKRSTTWRAPTAGQPISPPDAASRPRLRWTPLARRRAGRARPSSRRRGPIRSSTPSSGRSTTSECSRTRPAAGAPGRRGRGR